MAYSEGIEKRIEQVLSAGDRSDKKKMFGGICYLKNGRMFCGVLKEYLILRLGEKKAAEVLSRQHVRPFDTTGRPMKGWVMVEEQGFDTKEELTGWLQQSLDFVRTLPEK